MLQVCADHFEGTENVMPDDHRFTLASAIAAAESDELAEWVGELLASRGSDNEILAAALAQQLHFWTGPLQVPVDELVRLAGPTDEVVLCPIEPEEWEADVGAMEESIDDGWDPPPLLAQYQNGQLLLQDGNHRFEALTRAGESHAWVIVYCDTPAELDHFRAQRTYLGGSGLSGVSAVSGGAEGPT